MDDKNIPIPDNTDIEDISEASRLADEEIVRRISTKLRRKLRAKRLKYVLFKWIWLFLLLGIVICIAGGIYIYRDLLNKDTIKQAVKIIEAGKNIRKIGGALDVAEASVSSYRPFASGIAALGTASLRYATVDGKDGFIEEIVLPKPLLVTDGEYAVAYSEFGTTIYLANKKGILGSASLGGEILSAAVNARGMVSVVTKEAGYKTSVSLYSPSLELLYKWDSPDFYATATTVSPDGKMLAVAVVYTENGEIAGAVKLFKTDAAGVYATCPLGSCLPVALYADEEGVGGVGDGGMFFISYEGEIAGSLDFTGLELVSFARDGEDGWVFLFRNEEFSGRFTVTRVDKFGQETARFYTNRDISDFKAAAGQLAVLYDGEVYIYDTDLVARKIVKLNTFDVKSVIMLYDGTLVLRTAEELLVP